MSIWVTQTDIGDKFGISAIKVGQILMAEGLKHPNTNKPTSYAYQNGFAQHLGKSRYRFATSSIWNSDKIEVIINKSYPYLQRDEFYTYRIESTLRRSRYKSVHKDYRQLYDVVSKSFFVPKDVHYAKMVAMINLAMKIEKNNVRNAICGIITNVNLSADAIEDLRTAVKLYHKDHVHMIDKLLLLK